LRLLLVVREDFLGALQALESQLPKLLEAPFRLQWLSHEAARAAIEEPAKPFKVTWEPALVQRLLDELYEGTNSGIAPPQLQMVCDFLYRYVVENSPQRPIISSWKVTLAQFEALGGTEAILGNYLDQALLSLPAPQQATARSLLSALVSSTGTKQRLPLTYLARVASVSPASAKTLLEKLSDELLVRRYEREGIEQPTEYELTHQFLALHIARWLDETFWAVQGAREIVRQALPDWQGEQSLLPPGKLRLLAVQRHRLPFSPEEAAMLYAAAVSYNHSPEQWEALLPVPARRAVLLNLLHHREASARLQATSQLIAVANREVSEALVQTSLTDSEPNVREAAIESLIRASRTDSEIARVAVAPLVEAHKEAAATSLAHAWLVYLRDQQPLVHQMLPAELRTPLQREVWRVRWRRQQDKILTTTLRGMQGGFWGLGLGMGLLLVLLDAALFERNLFTMRAIIQLATLGWALAGLLGALTAGSAAFVQVLLQTLPDNDNPPRTWAISTLVSTLLMGLGFFLLVYIFSSSPQPQVAIAGLVIGFALTSVATAPSAYRRQGAPPTAQQSSRPLHLALAALAGVIAFVLVEQLGLILRPNPFATPNVFIYIGEREFEFSRSLLQWIMLIVIGLSSGIGFFLGLNRPSPPYKRDKREVRDKRVQKGYSGIEG
jgi:hypothetical protein